MSGHPLRLAVLSIGMLTPIATPAAARQRAATPARSVVDASAWAGLPLRHIGPIGNRVIAVAGIPGDPSIYYAGAASGGIWKTTDGGLRWEPIFDDQPVQSIGSLAVAPSDPNIVWAGTGESFIRSHISIGAGIFKSTDAGKTWVKMGLDETGRIGRIVIHPTDLQQLRLTGRGQDGVRWPAGLATKLMYVANGIASSDFAPTTQQAEVSSMLISQVNERRQDLDRIVQQDLAAFNQMLARRSLRSIIME